MLTTPDNSQNYVLKVWLYASYGCVVTQIQNGTMTRCKFSQLLSSFLQVDVVQVSVSTESKQLVPLQHMNTTWGWAPWSVTEDRLRDVLHKFKKHKVLHFNEMGHVLLDGHRQWESRKAHATHDVYRVGLSPAA